MARRDQCPARYLSLAGFEVTIIGRFWVTAEGPTTVDHLYRYFRSFSNFDNANRHRKTALRRHHWVESRCGAVRLG